MSKLFRTACVLACALPVVYVSLVRADSGPQGPQAQGSSTASGALHKNSRHGAVLSASALAPGDSATGTVTFTAGTQSRADMTLSGTGVRDTPGPNGGVLSDRLELTVKDITGRRPARSIYRGKLGDIGTRQLPTMSRGERRTYRFSVRFPEGGTPPSATTGDNAYLASAAEVGFRWTSRAL